MGKEREGQTIIYNDTNSRRVVKTDSIVDGVIDKLIDRAVVGKKKYGVTLDRNDLSLNEWLTHLQEELMDAVNYIERIKKVVDGEKRSNIN
jgi:hypothetical protein